MMSSTKKDIWSSVMLFQCVWPVSVLYYNRIVSYTLLQILNRYNDDLYTFYKYISVAIK